MSFVSSKVECGADALRRFEQGGRLIREWKDLPAATKKKWVEKASVVLEAVERESLREKTSG